MCGIAGIISFDASEISREKLEKMNDSLAHRGPDGSGIFLDHIDAISIGLAHRRLTIIDPTSNSDQPLLYLDRYVIVHNGEIYNYESIRKTLIKHNYPFKSNGDTEVIAAAYAHYGNSCVDHFEGMFAFAIWDKKEKKLFCARDRFGEKPFFYHYDSNSGTLHFASEMKALFAAGIEKNSNMSMLHAYLTLGMTKFSTHPEQTFYQQIHSLQPSHTLVYSPLKSEIYSEKYWDLDKESKTTLKVDEYIDNFNELFSDAVRIRTRSDLSFGSTLSGGIDSTSLAYLLSSNANPLYSKKTFSAIFPGFINNEEQKIKSIAKQLDLNAVFVTPNADALVSQIDEMMYFQEEPINSSSVFAQYKVFETAKRNNIKVLFDGQGADEVLAGYIKYTKWYLHEIIRTRGLRNANKIAKDYTKNNFLKEWGCKEKLSAYMPHATKYLIELKTKKKAFNHEFISAGFTKEYYSSNTIFKPEVRKLNDILYSDVMINGLEELLRYADRNSMAHGCEVRLPFLDHKLVEFIFSAPSSLKFADGWNKWLLRNFLKGKLPDEIVLQKGKIGFETPQEQWMNEPSMKEVIMEGRKTLIKKGICKKEFLDSPVKTESVHAADNFEWRCLSASIFLK